VAVPLITDKALTLFAAASRNDDTVTPWGMGTFMRVFMSYGDLNATNIRSCFEEDIA